MIFVFGSNEKGIHGAGAARYARMYEGAIYGIGFGYHGNSFAIPTKDVDILPLDLADISVYVDQFIVFAQAYPHLDFKVTRIGCGLAGFKDREIAPFFLRAPTNCFFDEKWKPWLGDHFQYWGSA